MHRTYGSGAVKRKNKEETARKDEELRNKIPCITFFMKERTTAEVSDSIESTVALAPVTVDNELMIFPEIELEKYLFER